MKILKSFIACFSTYSRIPMPVTSLDSDDMKYALIFFPVIGAVIGLLEYCLFIITGIYAMPKMFRVLIMAVIPLVITGGIHIDGFMDTSDAFGSYGDRDKKLAIMKDPHTGAFAVIKFAVYGLLFVAFSYLINDKSILIYSYCFVIARALSGVSVVTIQGAKSEGMLHDMNKNTHKKSVLYTLIAIGIICLFIISQKSIVTASLMLIASLIGYFAYRKKMIRDLGGITGDTTGYFMCIMELTLIIISTIGGYI